MNQTIRQSKAIAAYRAQLNKSAEAKRQKRIEAMKTRLIRRYVREKSGWAYAFLSAGIALGIVIVRTFN